MTETPQRPPPISEVSSASEPMRAVLAVLARVAKTSVPVVLLGETGVGKTWLAGAIHEDSGVKNRFVHVACPSIPEPLLESELFGHVRGAFTGAERTRVGMLARARDGTLFLDEIGDLPASLQAKLLLALEHGEFRPVGSDCPIHSRFRLISATNTDLEHRIATGLFRADLYHRLGRARIVVPPLRQRRTDIPALAATFLAGACREHGGSRPRLDTSALQTLMRHPWPGNVRELGSLMSLVAVTCTSGRIGRNDVLPYLSQQANPATVSDSNPRIVLPWKTALQQFEQTYWNAILSAAEGCRREAASLAGVSERMLYTKLRKHAHNKAAPTRRACMDVQSGHAESDEPEH